MNNIIKLLLLFIAVSYPFFSFSQQIYVVQPGETLEQIAERNNLGVDELISSNPGAADFFFAGMQLNIPQGSGVGNASAAGYGLLPTAETIRDHYRRSSICLILIAHTDKPYADAMVRVFQNFPMPLRYNNHNIDLRVVEVNGKQSQKDIEKMLFKNSVGREVVGKWFNRDGLGKMDMSLVHERGGYGAFHDDYMRTVNTVRGTATLRDEGIELLESTFVLVCDMEYAEQNKGFKIGAVLSAVGSVAMAGLSAYSEIQGNIAYSKGDYQSARQNYNSARTYAAGSSLAATGAQLLNDLSKFRVNIHSYLYKLNWDEARTANMFNNYWVDDYTPEAESNRRRQSFDRAQFGLEYIGDYSKASSKTKLVSCTDVDKVVLDVCHRSVEESVKALADKFEVFRPRTPFYCADGGLYSHIGTKEDVEYDKKYEIVKRSKSKNGKIEYKRVGVVKAGSPWKNAEISFDRYFSPEMKGTHFKITKGKYEDIAQTPGLQIREMK